MQVLLYWSNLSLRRLDMGSMILEWLMIKGENKWSMVDYTMHGVLSTNVENKYNESCFRFCF